MRVLTGGKRRLLVLKNAVFFLKIRSKGIGQRSVIVSKVMAMEALKIHSFPKKCRLVRETMGNP